MKVYPALLSFDYEASLVVAGLVIEKVERLKREGRPPSRGLSEVHACVDKALAEAAARSRPRTNSVEDMPLSAEEMIDVAEAAEIIDTTKRYVQKIAREKKIDAEWRHGRWLFDKTLVENFAKKRKPGARSA